MTDAPAAPAAARSHDVAESSGSVNAIPDDAAASSREGGEGRELPTKLAVRAWESLFRAQVAIVRALAADDAWQELSMRDYDVLYTLARAGAPLRQGDLAAGVLLTQPSLSRLIDRLVARGLVAKSLDPTDRRAQLLSLTDAGRAAQRRVGRGHAADIRRHLSALTPDEAQTLIALTTKLTDAQPAT